MVHRYYIGLFRKINDVYLICHYSIFKLMSIFPFFSGKLMMFSNTVLKCKFELTDEIIPLPAH